MTPEQMQELGTKIHLYGREMVTVGNEETIKSAVVGAPTDTLFIVGFRELMGGCLTFLHEHPYPMRFVFQTDKIVTLTQVKRLIPTLVNTVRHSPILSVLYLWRNWTHFIDFIHHAMRDVFADPKFYNQPVREFYKSIVCQDKIRDILCAVIEYDSAYRYRFQDMMCEIDREALNKTFIGEIRRLIRVYTERDTHNFIKNKIGRALPIILAVAWWYRKDIQKFIGSTDIKNIKPSVEDEYWMKRDTSYKYAIS